VFVCVIAVAFGHSMGAVAVFHQVFVCDMMVIVARLVFTNS
tara:strand:- start:17 stop:139 length:123 start_codon:yes stop_codon:yes gene_type:complete